MTLQSDSMLFPKINKKNFAKPIDKSLLMWYNVYNKERGNNNNGKKRILLRHGWRNRKLP